MKTIIGLSGRKQSGKDTGSAFLAARLFVNSFNQYHGEQVSHVIQQPTGFIKIMRGDKPMVIGDPDSIFDNINNGVQRLIGNGKIFCSKISCATPIKQFMIDTLGIERKICYGTDIQKNAPTKYTWQLVPQQTRQKYGKKQNDSMSARDIMVYVGTHLFRQQFYNNVWAEGLIKTINNKYKNCMYIFVPDIRFPNQADTILQNNGLVIRLNRVPFALDTSKPQTALDDYNWDRQGCKMCYNQQSIITEKNKELQTMISWIENHK